MREAEARRVLLIQAVEEVDTKGELLSTQERALATHEAIETARGDPETMLAGRAERLCERLDQRDGWYGRALRLTRFPRALGPAVVAGSVAAGLLVNALGPERRINVLSFPLLGLLAWNLAIYALLAVHFARRLGSHPVVAGRGGGALAAALAWWTERVARGGGRNGAAATTGAVSLYASRWVRVAEPVLAARVGLLFHLGASGLAAGIVTGMYIRGVAFEYQATWESTFLDANGARTLLGLVLKPAAALLDLPLPDADALGKLRAPGAGPAAQWIHRYAVTALLAVVVPRGALALAAGLRARALAKRFPIERPDLARELLEHVQRRAVEDRVHRIDAQPIDVVVLDPCAGIVEHEPPHLVAAAAVEVDGLTPRRGVAIGEIRAEAPQVVAGGPEMVVDHVQQDGQPALVAGVDEALQAVGPTVGVVRREQVHAVVAPAASARKLGHRHQFDMRDAEIDQMREPLDC